MEQTERAQQRAKAEREADREQLGPHHGYTPCSSASFAGAGDFDSEVPDLHLPYSSRLRLVRKVTPRYHECTGT